MIAYREKYLAESVKDCYEKAASPENLLFSIVSEQHDPNLHADLGFIPDHQIVYRKYDLSEYRGVLWSRHKTTLVDFDYDYILFTCGHNRFVKNWDLLALSEYKKAEKHSSKAVLTFAGPEMFYSESEVPIVDNHGGRTKNYWRSTLDSSYVPGYGWPTQKIVPETGDVLEETYLQYSWVFANKNYVTEVPLDPSINYHAEEIYMTIKTWCAGWRMYTTSVIMYYHDTVKKYPKEILSRMDTHRPWSDINKDAFWQQSDESMLKLNQLLSSKNNPELARLINDYCSFSGLSPEWCKHNEHYDKLEYRRHAEDFRDRQAFPLF